MRRLRSVQTPEDVLIEKVEAVAATVGSTAVAPLLRGKVPELYVTGDANAPQTVMRATYQGGRTGRLL